MSQQSDSFSTKPGLSGLRNRKIISGVVEGKSQTEYESSWSPTSPLDFRLFSSFGNPFGTSSTSRLIRKRKQESWDSEKVGLGLVDSLDDDRTVLPSPDGKNRVLMRNGNPKCRKPYPSNPVVDDLPVSFHPLAKAPMELLDGSSSVNGSGLGAGNVTDGSSSVSGFGLGAGNVAVEESAGEVMKQSEGSFVGSEKMEVSEDYTCVIAHGPNPKTTHFYGDQVVESVEDDGVKMPFCGNKKKECIFGIETLSLTSPPAYLLASSDFLSFCWLCRKKLFRGKEIYMYRGYRAFCSSECRAEEIRRDEIIEKGAEAKEEGYEAESDSGSSSDKDLPKKKTNRAFVTMG